MKSSSRRRPGLSLAEVLIAIFVMALGLLGILSLFPLAAVNMAQAIKDENTAQLNQSATAYIRWAWKDEITDPPLPTPAKTLYPDGPLPTPYNALPSPTQERYDPLFNAMANPNFSHNPDYNAVVPGGGNIPPAYVSTTTPVIPPTWAGPSYPVFVDPIGWNNSINSAQPQQYWVAGLIGGIPRRSLRKIEWFPRSAPWNPTLYSIPNPRQSAVPYLYPPKDVLMNRLCYRLDDVGYGKDGTPYDQTGIPTNTSNALGFLDQGIQRDGRYSCAFMLKRPANNISKEAELTVVVYNARSLDGPSDETAYQTLFTQNSNEAILIYSGATPKIRKGQWILDATMTRPSGATQSPESHGYFYRIVNINSDTPGQLILELQTPAHWWPDAGSSPSTMDGNGSIYGVGVIMDGVVEVFERGTLTQFTMPVP